VTSTSESARSKKRMGFQRAGDLYKARVISTMPGRPNEAIRLEPSYAIAFFSGATYTSVRATMTRDGRLDESDRLDPNDAKAYLLRGRLSYMKGDGPAHSMTLTKRRGSTRRRFGLLLPGVA